MPWKIYQDSSDGKVRHCIHKKNADGSMGELVNGGCHATRDEAVAQLRALYASEKKDITVETLDLLKEITEDELEDKSERALAVLDEWKARTEIDEEVSEEKSVEQSEDDAEEKTKRSDVSAADRKRAVAEYGNVDYADEENKKYPLDTEEHIRAANSYLAMPKNAAKYSSEKVAAMKRKIIAAWKKKIDPKGPPSAQKKDLLEKLKDIGEAIKSWFDKEPEDQTELSIWKEGNQYWWLARYSNKFRDNDSPPEIISSDSHKRFVELVKEGKAPKPELWAWHNKGWKVGNAHSVAYDDTGFAVAIGTFDKGKENVAKALINTKEPIKLSHGMPISSIKRDKVDPTIIVEHETREISFLPAWAAANKLTGFAVLNLESKEESMAIPEETKKEWISNMGIDPETLNTLEETDAADADKALSEGIESKEKEEEAQPAASEPETEAKPEEKSINEELLTAVKDAITSVLAPLNERITELEKNLQTVKEASDKRDEALKGTPTASLSALLGDFASSAIGAEENKVDGREKLAKSKPQETAANAVGPTIVPFINEILAGNKQ
jgi:hypothetical protein